jgi:penicillin-binding protein 1A
VTAVWVGNDDNTPLNGIAGGGMPARIWRDFMSTAIDSAPVRRAVQSAPRAAPESEADVPFTADARIGDLTVGIGIGEDGVTLSATPNPDAPAPGPRRELRLPAEVLPPRQDPPPDGDVGYQGYEGE